MRGQFSVCFLLIDLFLHIIGDFFSYLCGAGMLVARLECERDKKKREYIEKNGKRLRQIVTSCVREQYFIRKPCFDSNKVVEFP